MQNHFCYFLYALPTHHVGESGEVLWDHHGNVKGSLDGWFVPTRESSPGVSGLHGGMGKRWKDSNMLTSVCKITCIEI